MKGRTRTTLLAALLTLGGCASMSPPERPAWDGPDLVDQVDPARLVGVWRVTPLNPYPEQGAQDTVIEYRADGTVTGEIDPGEDEAMAAFGDVRFEMNGRWSVADGRVSHEDVKMETIGDSQLARLMSSMVNSVERDLGGEADIRELEDDSIVMLGTDGAAMRYERLR